MAFQIIKGDITRITADAIVNSANPEPIYARGVDAAIYLAAGAEALLEERKKIGTLETGEVASTPAFALPAKHIIHTVGPIWAGGSSGELIALSACYRNALELAEKLECESIAFPMISTGVYGFPKDRALETALIAIRSFLERNDDDMEVTLVVNDSSTYQLPSALLGQVSAYLDRRMMWEDGNLPGGSMPPAPGSAAPASGAPSASPQYNSSYASPAKAVRRRDALFNRRRKEKLSEAEIGENLKERIEHIGDTFQECLLAWIDQKGLTDVDVYKKANLDRKLFSKIRCNVDYKPKKQTAVALAIALELSRDEAVDLLRRAGIAFSPSSVFDLIIEYCLEYQLYDIYEVNALLFEYDQPLLGC